MERRIEDRLASHLHLTCRVPARPCRAVMHDVSYAGCRLEFGEIAVEVGGTTLLDIPGTRDLAGRVMWAHGHQVGIQFDRRLGSSAAVALGLEEPAPEPVLEEPAEDTNGGIAGILRHWIRRLVKR